jgi:3alpha(or 20beta)-hydroxysteroid dehydrogenase
MGEPEEIAQTALFLASDDCKFATGQPFVIDGGWISK